MKAMNDVRSLTGMQLVNLLPMTAFLIHFFTSQMNESTLTWTESMSEIDYKWY